MCNCHVRHTHGSSLCDCPCHGYAPRMTSAQWDYYEALLDQEVNGRFKDFTEEVLHTSEYDNGNVIVVHENRVSRETKELT